VNNDGDLTNFVCTRWYRPPELVMEYARETYDQKIDMFSVGCVLAEILTGKILFQSQDTKEQINLITQILGDLPQDLLLQIRSLRMQEYILKSMELPKTDWQDIFFDVDIGFISLLRGLLEFNPSKRLSAE